MNNQPKKQANINNSAQQGRRRIIIMSTIIVVLIAAVSGIWVFLAGKVSDVIDTAIAEQKQNGNDIDCTEREKTGYPFRIGIKCTTLAVTLNSGEVTFKTNELRTAAQIYQPGKVVGEVDGPFALRSITGEEIDATWQNTRFSFKADFSGKLERFALQLEEPRFNIAKLNISGSVLANAKNIEVYARRNEGTSADLAARLTHADLSLPANSIQLQSGYNQKPLKLPPFNMAFNANFKNAQDIIMGAKDLIAYGRQNGLEGVLREMAIQPKKGGILHLSGPFSINQQGILTGEMELKFAQLGEILFFVGEVDPALSQSIGGFQQIIEQLAKPVVQNNEESGEKEAPMQKLRTIHLSVNEGKIRLGIFPLGKLPPLF